MSNKFSYIYALTEDGKPPTVENIRYIGKTCRSLALRRNGHIDSSRRRGHYCANWIKSLLIKGSNPAIHPIMIVEHSQASEMEIKTIALYSGLGSRLTNLTVGGEGVWGCKNHLGHKHSAETRNKISISLSGPNHPQYGRHPSEETRRKISLANSGYKHTYETRAKMSLSKTGTKLSPEHKYKIAISQQIRRDRERYENG